MTQSKIACPQCNKESLWSKDNPNRPFCSERCKLIDLGAWANGSYQISVAIGIEEDDFSTGLMPNPENIIH